VDLFFLFFYQTLNETMFCPSFMSGQCCSAFPLSVLPVPRQICLAFFPPSCPRKQWISRYAVAKLRSPETSASLPRYKLKNSGPQGPFSRCNCRIRCSIPTSILPYQISVMALSNHARSVFIFFGSRRDLSHSLCLPMDLGFPTHTFCIRGSSRSYYLNFVP